MEDKDNQVHIWEPSAFSQAIKEAPPRPITDPERLALYERLDKLIEERGRKRRLLKELKDLKGK